MIWGNRSCCNFGCLGEIQTKIGTQILPAYRISILEIVNLVFNSEMFEFHVRVLSFIVCFGSWLPGIHQ